MALKFGPLRFMSHLRLAAAGLAAVMVAAAATTAAAHSLEALERELGEREFYLEVVNMPAPPITLRDADGRSVGLADLRGKVVVLNFIYTSCPDVCPLHSERIAELQAMVNETPMRDLVVFVSVTTDPIRDGTEVMRSYGAVHGLDPHNWLFLTSGSDAPAATRELAQRFGLKFTETADGYQMHGVVTHLIDKSGNLRARYHGLKFDPLNFVLHVNALTNDYH